MKRFHFNGLVSWLEIDLGRFSIFILHKDRLIKFKKWR